MRNTILWTNSYVNFSLDSANITALSFRTIATYDLYPHDPQSLLPVFALILNSQFSIAYHAWQLHLVLCEIWYNILTSTNDSTEI